jgi:two-component system, chemotaxis family, protein-glutamate methylesterase/glutaminase
MRKIRVLIVDDSTVIRRLLSDSLSGSADIEVVGTAPNGKIALAKIPQLAPDLITLDIEMPEMDGLTAVREIRKVFPKLPIIMFSTLTQRGAESTLDALANGANDYVTKPANVGSVTVAIQSVKDELIPKIKSLCKWQFDDASAGDSAKTRIFGKRPFQETANKTRKHSAQCVAIGSSTGGPNALMTVLKSLPSSFPVPILVVQHMPPVFTKQLANRLDQNCELQVVEAQPGLILKPGLVAIAPGDFHMTVKRKGTEVVVDTNQCMPENSCRPAVDVLFRSVADVYGPGVVSVVLTGMGQDGKRGAEQINDLGGWVIAQDEETSVVWGMPRAVTEAGCANEVLPLNSISDQLRRITTSAR